MFIFVLIFQRKKVSRLLRIGKVNTNFYWLYWLQVLNIVSPYFAKLDQIRSFKFPHQSWWEPSRRLEQGQGCLCHDCHVLSRDGLHTCDIEIWRTDNLSRGRQTKFLIHWIFPVNGGTFLCQVCVLCKGQNFSKEK